ncbi:MAG: hypothetical protein KF850_08685 [Labilithrix sp.]|nr:hypothetical protein [Labilithrix sp.]
MSRLASLVIIAAAAASVLSAVACSGGQIAVGRSDQQLLTRKDGTPTGNGQTCSWDDTVTDDGQSTPAPNGTYAVGDNFAAPDGCNDCTCTTQGIMCTVRECGAPEPGACPDDAKICSDGTVISRSGPDCSFAACPDEPNGCSRDAHICPDGSTVGRTGPKCEFVCPGDPACDMDAKQCPDGSFVGRTGPKCEFAPCP